MKAFSYKIILFNIIVLLMAIQTAYAESSPSTKILLKAIKISDLSFCNEKVPLERFEIKERFEKEMLLILWDKPQVILWLKRAARYFPHIEEELKKNKIPDDLKYIVVIESAVRPHIGSRKGARGFWQFIPGTARQYGLKVNRFADDRRDIKLSTLAAIKYLKKLYIKFDSWTLAAAAYNMGERGLNYEMTEQDVIDFYNLHLPLETQRYILRIIAAKYIMKDPSKFGFDIKKDDLYKPYEFDEIIVSTKYKIPLRIVAQAAGTYFKKIKDLNPKFRKYYLRGTHEIRIPKDEAKNFFQKYRPLVAEYLKNKTDQTYVVRNGDNLTTIAEQFNIPLKSLVYWNQIKRRDRIHPGDKLVIYKKKSHQN
ncbi:MAG: transglycosylase SLT domain-containing protein [Desulfobacterales bacterium]|nr:transglycosylase SLT domain-containing protein [Desulfobacterales bacterium]